MGIRRSGVHQLPPNPVYVEFPRSDGDRKTWPTDTECIVDKGQVNYFRLVELDESLAILWRKTVGMKVAESLGLPGASESLMVVAAPSLRYILCSWEGLCTQGFPSRISII